MDSRASVGSGRRQGVFVVSGFLIFMSFERSSSIRSYAGKRLRRILPAYVVVVVLCAFLLWSVSSLPSGRYFSSDWLKYVAANLAFLNFLHPDLPGVFEGHRVPAVNGALWTLKIEVMFYVSVPLFVYLFRRFGHFLILTAGYLASVLYAMVVNGLATEQHSILYEQWARQFPGQLSYFMAGGLFYYFLPIFEHYRKWIVFLACSVLTFNSFVALPAFEPIALGAIVAYVGLFLHAANLGKYGDFSYGVYILHFPVIQLLIHGGWLNDNAYSFLAAASTLTLAGGVVMWHVVEKRFLFRDSHYVSATRVEELGS